MDKDKDRGMWDKTTFIVSVMTERKRRLLLHTIVMTATTLCVRGMGMGFNAWLSGRIGAEGVGLFQLILSVYGMAIMLALSGMRLASARLCSEALARGESPRRVISSCLRVSGGLGLAALGALFLLADLAAGVLGYPGAAYPLRILSLALPMIAMETSLNGYLTARRRVPLAGTLHVVEQLLRVGLTVAALRALPDETPYAILAVAMGMTGANVLSFSLLFALCLFDLRKMAPAPREAGLFARIRRIALPDAMGSWIRSGLSTTEQMLIPGNLEKAGPRGMATYGMIQGMAMPVLWLPGAPMQALAGLLVPEISRLCVLGHPRTIARMVRRAIGLAFAYSGVVAACIIGAADWVAVGLYKNPDAAVFIRLLAPLVLFMYTDAVVDQMLKGLDQQMFCMRLNTADCVLRVVMVLLLLPIGGTMGYAAMLYGSAIFNASLSLRKLLRVSRCG